MRTRSVVGSADMIGKISDLDLGRLAG